MLNISFGEVSINSSTSEVGRVIFSYDLYNESLRKFINVSLKNSTLLLGAVNDRKELVITDSNSNFVIYRNMVTLHNLEVYETDNVVTYFYTFIE